MPSPLTSNVDLKHHVRIRLCVIESRSLLLDTSCGNQTIESTLCVTNALDNRVEALHIPDVDLAVVESVACELCVSSCQFIQFKQTNAYQAPQQLVAALCKSPRWALAAYREHTPSRQPQAMPLLAQDPDLLQHP